LPAITTIHCINQRSDLTSDLISQAPPRWWTGGSTAARRLITHRLKSSTRYSISFSTISNICIAQPPPSIDLNHKLEIEEEGIYTKKEHENSRKWRLVAASSNLRMND